MPAVTTVFDLSDRLSAKNDPALIGADEAHLTAVAEALAGQVAALAGRLDELRRSPGGTGRAAMDRDLEIHRLSSDLRVVRRYGLDVCLGRTVSAAQPDQPVQPAQPDQSGQSGQRAEPVYIGRIGLADRDGRRLLVDWRTPAAEPFFAATAAHPAGLVSRRRYRWSGGRITDYWDEVFGDGGDPGAVALDQDSAFIASLGSNRSSQMRDVLATIQSDQDAIIRADSRGALVVDGGPGTGKTVVALHRTAYLLYADPRLGGRRGEVLVVGPHRPYLSYVADVLPSLGEEGVLTCTLADLLPEGEAAVEETDPEMARLKASAELVAAIEPAVRLYEEPPTRSVLVETDWGTARVTKSDWAEAFAAPDPGTPHNLARDQIWDALAEIVADQLADRAEEDVPLDRLGRVLRSEEELAETLDRAWTLVDAADLVGDLWSVPAYLRRCAPGLSAHQVQTLQRAEPQAWTTADLPLLDAARHRLGDPDAARRRRVREAEADAVRERMYEVVDDLIRTDDTGLMIMLKQDIFRDALVDPAALSAADPDRLAGPFAHLVVDEAQELTYAEWQMLLRRCPSRSVTVVGDRAQARNGFAESWQQRLERVGFGTAREATLTINYRTPAEIMAEAEPVIRSVIPDANVPTSVRTGGLPVRHASVAERDEILERWSAENPEGIGCVIGDPTFAGTPRIRSSSPVDTKGLEFDLVVLVDPDRLGDGVAATVDRYVAMTRATRELVVLDR